MSRKWPILTRDTCQSFYRTIEENKDSLEDKINAIDIENPLVATLIVNWKDQLIVEEDRYLLIVAMSNLYCLLKHQWEADELAELFAEE